MLVSRHDEEEMLLKIINGLCDESLTILTAQAIELDRYDKLHGLTRKRGSNHENSGKVVNLSDWPTRSKRRV